MPYLCVAYFLNFIVDSRDMSQWCYDNGTAYDTESSDDEYESTDDPAHRAEQATEARTAAGSDIDIGQFLRQLQSLIQERRILPSYTGSGCVVLAYFDEQAAANGDEPFKNVYIPNLQLPVAGTPERHWPNN